MSFGQSAFFGTGGMVAAYLLTVMNFPHVMTAIIIGTIVATIIGFLVGLIALRRTGIYFAMITVAIAEVFYFVEFNPLSEFTGGENGLPGVPTPVFDLGFTTFKFDTDWSLYTLLAFCYFIGIVLALRIMRSPVGAILSAIRDNPLRAAAVGHNIHSYKLTAFVIAATYAGFAGGLLGVMQGFMPPDAFTFETSGQLVMQTAIGGAGTLFGPLIGATVWLYLSDFFQTTLHLGATWKLVLGLVFVLLVCFLRRGHFRRAGRSGRLGEAVAAAPRRRSIPTRASDDAAEADFASSSAPVTLAPLCPAARRRSCRRKASASVTAAWSPMTTSTLRSSTANCAASLGRTGRARAPSSRCSPARSIPQQAASFSRARTSPASTSRRFASSASPRAIRSTSYSTG